jgi:hypothetical protein
MRQLGLYGTGNALGVPTHRVVRNPAYNGRTVHSAIRASFFRPCARQTTTAFRAKNEDDLVDVEVVFDGVEDDELGFADSASSVTALTGSVAVVADQLTGVAMRFVPEGTSFEVVRVAVVGGIVLVVLSFVKGLLSLVLTFGTIGFGAYLYTSVYGDVGGNSGPTRRAGRGRRRTKKKKASTKGTAAGPTLSPGSILSGIINSTGQGRADDGLLDVTFKKSSKPKKPKR